MASILSSFRAATSAGVDYVVRGGDAVAHYAHRHEPPVRGTAPGELEVVAETRDLFVVSKPATVPVHPCGSYRKNSLFHVLAAARRDAAPLHVVHRLDRLTSGLT